MKFFFFRT